MVDQLPRVAFSEATAPLPGLHIHGRCLFLPFIPLLELEEVDIWAIRA